MVFAKHSKICNKPKVFQVRGWIKYKPAHNIVQKWQPQLKRFCDVVMNLKSRQLRLYINFCKWPTRYQKMKVTHLLGKVLYLNFLLLKAFKPQGLSVCWVKRVHNCRKQVKNDGHGCRWRTSTTEKSICITMTFLKATDVWPF